MVGLVLTPEGEDNLRRVFGSNVVSKSVKSATFKTTAKTRTEISKRVRDIYAVKAGLISKSASIRNGSSVREKMLLYTGANISLTEFGPRQRLVRTAKGKRKGVSVRIRKDRGRKLVKSGFSASLKGGKFIGKRKTDTRFPIRGTSTVSVPGMVKSRDVIKLINKFVGEEYPAQFEREMLARLRGYGR